MVEWRYLKTGNDVYQEIYRMWVKILAVAFGMGVVCGVVMSYQFGTNWSVFSDKVGNILGPLLGYVVLTAFFLEASFLAAMLFGWLQVIFNPSFPYRFAPMVVAAYLGTAFVGGGIGAYLPVAQTACPCDVRYGHADGCICCADSAHQLLSAGMLVLWSDLRTRREYRPFFPRLGLFFMNYVGLGISM